MQIAPLLFDTVITFMTVCKAFNIRRRNGSPNSRLIQTFLREGKSIALSGVLISRLLLTLFQVYFIIS